MFVSQKVAFPELIVPAWPPPLPDEILGDYCDRIAESLKEHEGCILGGTSFGGIIALHVAQRLKPECVLLISSVRSPIELPIRIRIWRTFRFLVPLIPVRFLQALLLPLSSKSIRKRMPRLCGVVRQFRSSDPAVFKWSLQQLLLWSTTPDVPAPIYQIHGKIDHVLPIALTKPDVVIDSAGHIPTLTHATAINDFIREHLANSSY